MANAKVGLPRELLPAGYIARITICALSGNAAFATKATSKDCFSNGRLARGPGP